MFRKYVNEGGKLVSPMHRPFSPPGTIPRIYFC